VYSKRASTSSLKGTPLGKLSAIAAALATLSSYATTAYVDAQTGTAPSSVRTNNEGGAWAEWTIFNIGSFTLAFVSGSLNDGATLRFPEGFDANRFIGQAAASEVDGLGSGWGPQHNKQATVGKYGFRVGTVTVDAHCQDSDGFVTGTGWVSVMGVAWKFAE
jgi:hypothetical protein